MGRFTSAMIDLCEAAYDLNIEDADWLPRVMQAGRGPANLEGTRLGPLVHGRLV